MRISTARAFVVAAIAAVVAVVWCIVVLGAEAPPVALFAAPASAVVWLGIVRILRPCRSTWRRLWVALGLGVLSPFPGIALWSLLSSCCLFGGVPGGQAALMHLWREPWLWLPVGAGMGLVAFAVVSVRRASPAS